MSFFNEQDSLEEWYKETDFESLSHEEKLKLANIEKELGNSFLKENVPFNE